MKLTVADSQACPPCTGNCAQGRDCPARHAAPPSSCNDCACSTDMIRACGGCPYRVPVHELPDPTEPAELMEPFDGGAIKGAICALVIVAFLLALLLIGLKAAHYLAAVMRVAP